MSLSRPWFSNCGAHLDIDQDDPVDLEPPFFLPWPVDVAERGLENNSVEWSCLPPLKFHLFKHYDVHTQVDIHANEAFYDAHNREGFCERAARRTYGRRPTM